MGFPVPSRPFDELGDLVRFGEQDATSHMTYDGTSPTGDRIELITSVERRRRRSAAEKTRLVSRRCTSRAPWRPR